MIGTITPLVQEAKRTWVDAVVGHVVGTGLSGSLLGFVLGACGLLLGLHRWTPEARLAGGIVFLMCAFRDVDLGHWALLSLRRQTPSWWLCAFGPKWAGFAWGIDLGQGWTTRIVFSGYYGLIFYAVVAASPVLSGLILGAYGLGRALPIFWAGTLVRRIELGQLSSAYVLRLPLIQRINAAVLAFVAGYFIMLGLSGLTLG